MKKILILLFLLSVLYSCDLYNKTKEYDNSIISGDIIDIENEAPLNNY